MFSRTSAFIELLCPDKSLLGVVFSCQKSLILLIRHALEKKDVANIAKHNMGKEENLMRHFTLTMYVINAQRSARGTMLSIHNPQILRKQ